jgi:iron complex outermembrane receptor protein
MFEVSRFYKRCLALSCFILFLSATVVRAESVDFDHLLAMDLAELMDIPIESASGIEESLRDAPAAMLVINAEDIRRRGYTSLDEIFADVPGFDAVTAGGTQHLIAYQRGYRTPFMQRTLFMIDGVVDNHLWTHGSVISRQYPLSAIERIEILYGPSSAVYGPNAFLGIVHIITKDGKQLNDGEQQAEVNLTLGSYQSRGIDASIQGKQGGWRYSLAAKGFISDEPDLDDYAPWGFLTEHWLNNRDAWGAVLDESHDGMNYGEFHDPTRDWGVLANVAYRDVTLGLIAWETAEGYGPFYAAEHVQPNAFWKHNALQTYLRHHWDVNEKLKVETLGLYHENRLWGTWVEATVDWDDDRYSYLSISDWNSQNHSWLFKQDYDYRLSETLRLTGGIKYEAKTLTKAYDLCSYWTGAYCSTDSGDTGPYEQGAGIFHSTDPAVVIAPGTLSDMPADNLAKTRDVGVYLQGIWQRQDWRWVGGLRYDRNSMYGSSINPRISTIYQFSDKTTVKLLYGEAFQEPSPIQLWGGWIGRAGNPDLQPESAKNLELVWLHQSGNWLHDVSLFAARYNNVIKEEAENAGSRDVFGLEYRGRFAFDNVIDAAPDISGHLYYTYTRSDSSIQYDHANAEWIDGAAELGDIAPHKINLGLDVPFNQNWYANLRVNYVSARDLYLRNPLRAAGRKADAYTVFHLAVGYQAKPWTLSLKVANLFDTDYYHPGVEQADSGDDFSQRALGFRNSLIPQPGRSFWLNARWRF